MSTHETPGPRDGRADPDSGGPLDDDTLDGDALLDPAESLRIIADQQAKVHSADPDARLMFGIWGAAWLVGYLALYLTSNGALPGGRAVEDIVVPATWSFILFSVCIAGAMATTIVYTLRCTTGVQGPSKRFGVMYGWTWCIAFVAMSIVLGGFVEAGASHQVVYLAANALSCLIVGVLYMASGAFWQDIRQYALGVWIILVAAISLYAGLPGTYLVMAVLGGGGLFAGAFLEHLRITAHRRRSAA
ncbi:hypothetical protein [Sanguibacter sp. 25GB23B1]|uniref:hypothetical protein n=1 Tax=unclassified Sanguibacter TaxID=2645534 RepID=UPI0032B00324